MDEQQAQVEQPQEPQGTTDWKSEARKWERYAKENAAAAKELESLKAAQMTEQEKLVRRAEDAERQLAAANATIQHSKDVAEVAAASGVPAALLEFCADRDAMESFAKQYGDGAPKVHAAPTAPSTRLARGEQPQPANEDVFAELVEQFFSD